MNKECNQQAICFYLKMLNIDVEIQTIADLSYKDKQLLYQLTIKYFKEFNNQKIFNSDEGKLSMS